MRSSYSGSVIGPKMSTCTFPRMFMPAPRITRTLGIARSAPTGMARILPRTGRGAGGASSVQRPRGARVALVSSSRRSHVAVTVAVVSGRGDVEGRVAVEESGRLEREPRVGDGRDRPIFGADDVMDAEAVPEHDVRVHQSTIRLHPRRQPGAARMLVGVVAGGMALARLVACDPEMVADEASAPRDARVGLSERANVLARDQLVGGGLAEHVRRLGVCNEPVAPGERVQVTLGFGLTREQP